MKVTNFTTSNYQQNSVKNRSNEKSNVKFGASAASVVGHWYPTIPQVRHMDEVLPRITRGGTVIGRIDANPVWNKDFTRIIDDSRLEALKPFFTKLTEHRTIGITHFSDGGNMEVVAEGLEKILPGRKVVFEPDITQLHETAQNHKPGVIVLADDIRKYAEDPKKYKGDFKTDSAKLARTVAGDAEAIFNEALPVSHRGKHMSMSQLPELFPEENRAGGPALIAELKQFDTFLKLSGKEPRGNVFSGGKADKVENLKEGAEFLPGGSIQDIGGALVNTVAQKLDFEVGEHSRIDTDTKRLKELEEFLAEGIVKKDGSNVSIKFPKKDHPRKFVTVNLPNQLIVKRVDGRVQKFPLNRIPHDSAVVDLGPRAMAKIEKDMSKFRTVYVNGPVGKTPDHNKGTEMLGSIMKKLKAQGSYIVAGGSDTRADLKNIFGEGFITEATDYFANSGGMGSKLVNGYRPEALELYSKQSIL